MKGKKGTAKHIKGSFRTTPCIIAFDQSYSRTGIAVCVNGEVKKAYSVDFKKLNLKGQSPKRLYLQEYEEKIIQMCLTRFEPKEITVIVERVRTFTQSDKLTIQVVKSHSALVGAIADQACKHGIKTYSVDTRAWKSKVLGSSKPVFEPIHGVKNPQKFGSVRKAIKLGFKEKLRIYKANKDYNYNDDMADAICMSLYPFQEPPFSMLLEC